MHSHQQDDTTHLGLISKMVCRMPSTNPRIQQAMDVGKQTGCTEL